MYVVAAAAQRETLALPHPGQPPPKAPQVQPVGVRHAISSVFVDGVPAALCGASVQHSLVFTRVKFDPGHAAACQRCAQLVSTTTDVTDHLRLEPARRRVG
jgi:hypothetical protein